MNRKLELEGLTLEDVKRLQHLDSTERFPIVECASLGLVQYASFQLGCFVPVSSEDPAKVMKQFQEAQLKLPAIYACVLASGSNWWKTPTYTSSTGHEVTTAEADMMLEKVHFMHNKNDELEEDHRVTCTECRWDAIHKILNAETFYFDLHDPEKTDPAEIPEFAKDPKRWPAFIKKVGRDLPFKDEWGKEWFARQRQSFHKEMQQRKLQSNCLFYTILNKALQINRDLKCGETNEDTNYGVGCRTVDALKQIADALKTAEGPDSYRVKNVVSHLYRGGWNVLGNAHEAAARSVA